MPIADATSRQRIPLLRISLRDATALINDMVDSATQELNFNITTIQDEIKWRLQGSATYSAKSAYRMLMGGEKIRWPFTATWKSKTPPTVRIFVVLLLQEKIMTHDILIKRSIHCEMKCVMCNICPLESAFHLFFVCQYATRVWIWLEAQLGYRIMKPATSIKEVWMASWHEVKTATRMAFDDWAGTFICA